ncbi:MAG: C10 family peptidase [Bacteroidales bacterium]|nr:C10 family peptidase [Bacteroidales bacterium]
MRTQLLMICCTLLCAISCSVDSITDKVSESIDSSNGLIEASPQTNSSFSVTPSMLNKYLKLFCKKKKPDIIVPIIENGEVLAYYVQYADNKGWDLVAADSRITPILSSSEEGALSIKEKEDLSIDIIHSTLHIIKEIKRDNRYSKINSIWTFLCPGSSYSKKRPSSFLTWDISKTKSGQRGFGQGMWIAQDTSIRELRITSPRLTSTKWHQLEPWNNYTQKENGINCPNGCGPVAAGQIIYKYLHNNPGNHPIPSSATVPINGDTVSFGTKTLTAWTHLVASHLVSDDSDTTAVFLSWLGARMLATYHLNSTGVKWNHFKSVLGDFVNYREGFDVGSNVIQQNRFCDTVYASITDGSPVIVATTNQPHYLIIDATVHSNYQYVITYVFDPNHIVTEYEYDNYPSWYFDWPNNYDPDHGIAEIEDCVDLTDNIYIKINWGLSSTQDNTNYLLRSRTYSFEEPISMIEYRNFTWTRGNKTYSGIDYWMHHFSSTVND